MSRLVVKGVGVQGHTLLQVVAESHGYKAHIRVLSQGSYSIPLKEETAAQKKVNKAMLEELHNLGFEATIENDGINSGIAFHTMY